MSFASPISRSSDGSKVGRSLNMTPKRPSLVRPTAFAMSLPRGLPVAWDHFGVPPVGTLTPGAGTGGGPVAVLAALAATLCDSPLDKEGPAASVASQYLRRLQRENDRDGGSC